MPYSGSRQADLRRLPLLIYVKQEVYNGHDSIMLSYNNSLVTCWHYLPYITLSHLGTREIQGRQNASLGTAGRMLPT